MFAPYCPVHKSRVLLFADNIESIYRSTDGLVVRYHCTCGHQGIWHPELLAA